ncbi:MAG: adenine deaminase [Deltaproteobacteria bacterium]|nr:adenine deaminase [Deltaproteobacteria bacterium]
MQPDELIQAARGLRPCDLLLANGRIVNVFSGEVHPGGVAVAGGRIAGLGDYPARRVVDLDGRFVAPGFIDSHVHIESSMAGVTEFARAVVVHGTTAVVADPHEIANVLGKAGIRYMLESAQGQPINVFYTLPACVPATAMETAGARLDASDLEEFFDDPRVVGLGEMMNYPGVLHGDPDVLKKIAAAQRHGRPVDGHCPGLSGRDLMAYAAAGILTDHECTHAREAQEKLAAGMRIMIRQATGARNLTALLPIVNAKSSRRLMWCTDDRHPHDLVTEGHIDAIVREAIRQGVDPIIAIQMATLNPAECFGLSHLGAIAPGRQADFVVFSDLSVPVAEDVYCRGVLVAQGGTPAPGLAPPPVPVASSMRVRPEVLDFTIRRAGDRIRVIEVVPDQIITRQSVEDAPARGDLLVSDPARDLLKIGVVERHQASGRMGIGFVRGLGLKRGAMASSVAHDSHNIIVAGVADADMRTAVSAVAEMGGGLTIVADGRILARLPLPVAGLMSQEPVHAVSIGMDRLVRAARNLGSTLKDPFMTLSFLALPVIPELKLTDLGLVDVRQFRHVPLFV